MNRFGITSALLGALLVSVATPALGGDWHRSPHEEWQRRSHVVPGYDAAPEARGCYWYRGRRSCSRYCYVEVDGRRFCRERHREAYPQAPFDDTIVVQPEKESRMKLGIGRPASPPK